MKLSKNAEKIARERYFIDDQENWEQLAWRVAKYVGRSEKEEYKNLFVNLIGDMKFIPGGRILRNAGRPISNLLNCKCIPIDDSIEQIGRCYTDCLISWANGAGVGIDFSPLRPKNFPIKGKGGEASGMVSFIEALDACAKTIRSGGQRRAAGWAGCSVYHPEVLDFIDAKVKDEIISHFNITVMIDNKFIDAVEKDLDWTFEFNKKECGKMKAKEIWDKIVSNMLKHAEPGILNIDNFRKNNSYYYDPVLAPNACGEATLSAYDVCCLGSLVLPAFVASKNTKWKDLEDAIYLSVRFLDDVLSVNDYVLEPSKVKAENSRRIGLGTMGLADYLFAKGLKYGSEEAIGEITKLYKFIRDKSYESSIKLASEKGSFPKFNMDLYCNSWFIKKLPAKIRMDIKKYGIRNVTLNAIAPTGTISLIPECVNSIEPMFCKGYLRKDKVGERIYIHSMAKDFVNNNVDSFPEWFVDSYSLTPNAHLVTQSTIQEYIDQAISKTINLPANTSSDILTSYLLEYARDLKGITVYCDGSKSGQILNPLSDKQIIEYIQKGKIIEGKVNEDDIKCNAEVCDF